jgi:hypothetical protein
MSDFLWARLKPKNIKAGHLIERLYFKDVLYRGGDRPDWYKVRLELAADLRKVKQEDTNPRSEPAFDLVSDDERKRIDHVENSRRMAMLGLVAAHHQESVSTPLREVDLTEPSATPVAPIAHAAPAAPVKAPAAFSAETAPPADIEAGEGRASAIPPAQGALTTDDIPRGGRRGRSSR